jgi:anti-sigma factor RsiW
MHAECGELRAGASAYADGEMSPSLAEKVRQHLGICQGCDRWMNTFKATVSLLRGMPKEQPPQSLRDKIRTIARE